jgi:allophanate hydrolase
MIKSCLNFNNTSRKYNESSGSIVKDNIDVINFLTTAAYPRFACEPTNENVPVVTKLEQACGILIGKTNIDQFATGLVGTRSPYSVFSSVFNKIYISDGLSSGSAIAVITVLVSIMLHFKIKQ